eukprot:94002_1
MSTPITQIVYKPAKSSCKVNKNVSLKDEKQDKHKSKNSNTERNKKKNNSNVQGNVLAYMQAIDDVTERNKKNNYLLAYMQAISKHKKQGADVGPMTLSRTRMASYQAIAQQQMDQLVELDLEAKEERKQDK